jgi:hypothetical protein
MDNLCNVPPTGLQALRRSPPSRRKTGAFFLLASDFFEPPPVLFRGTHLLMKVVSIRHPLRCVESPQTCPISLGQTGPIPSPLRIEPTSTSEYILYYLGKNLKRRFGEVSCFSPQNRDFYVVLLECRTGVSGRIGVEIDHRNVRRHGVCEVDVSLP